MTVAITPAQKYGNDGRNVSCGDAYQYGNNYVMNCNGACQGDSSADDDGDSGGGFNRVCTLQDNGGFDGDDVRYLRGGNSSKFDGGGSCACQRRQCQ